MFPIRTTVASQDDVVNNGNKIPAALLNALLATGDKTANYAVLAWDYATFNTTSGPLTGTLPTAPPNGTMVAAKLVVQGGTNAVTLACGGSDVVNHAGGPTSITLSILGQGVILVYASASSRWLVLADDLPVTGLGTLYARRLGRTFYVSDYGAVVYQSQTAAAAGTDSTTAIINATNAAAAAGGGAVYFDAGFYLVGGALKTTALGYAQIPLPVQPYDGAKISISWYCPEPAAAEIYPFGPDSANNAGAILVSTLTGQTYSSSHGVPSIVGGPTPEAQGTTHYGLAPQYFTNIYFETHGIAVRGQTNPTLTAWDLGCVLACNIIDGRADTVETGTGTTEPTHTWAWGLTLPFADNNVINRVGNFIVIGHFAGVSIAQHSRIDQLQALWCWVAVTWTGDGAGHGAELQSISREQCTIGYAFVDATNPVFPPSPFVAQTQAFRVNFDDVEEVAEHVSAWWGRLWDVYDPSNALLARICYDLSGEGAGSFKVFGGSNVAFENRRTNEQTTFKVATTAQSAIVVSGSGATPAAVAALIPVQYNGTPYQVPCYQTSPVTLFSQTGTGADSASVLPAPSVGSALAPLDGSTWGIAGNRFYCSAATGQYSGLVSDVGLADVTVQASFVPSATAADAGLMFRAADADNFAMVDATLSGGAGVINLYQKVGGAFVDGATASGLGMVAGTTYTLKVVTAGPLLKIYLNGTLIITRDYAWGLEGNTKHGLMDNFTADSNGGSRFANLSISAPGVAPGSFTPTLGLVSSLPTPTAALRGVTATLTAGGEPDRGYQCIQLADGVSYDWGQYL